MAQSILNVNTLFALPARSNTCLLPGTDFLIKKSQLAPPLISACQTHQHMQPGNFIHNLERKRLGAHVLVSPTILTRIMGVDARPASVRSAVLRNNCEQALSSMELYSMWGQKAHQGWKLSWHCKRRLKYFLKGTVALIVIFAVFPSSAETHAALRLWRHEARFYLLVRFFYFTRQAKHPLDLLSGNHL